MTPEWEELLAIANRMADSRPCECLHDDETCCYVQGFLCYRCLGYRMRELLRRARLQGALPGLRAQAPEPQAEVCPSCNGTRLQSSVHGFHPCHCSPLTAQPEAQQPAARTCSNCASMDIGSRASGSFCRTCGRDQPTAEPKLADHAFVRCHINNCAIGVDRCHHRDKHDRLDCEFLRSEHPEGR